MRPGTRAALLAFVGVCATGMACNRGGVFYWCEGNVLVWDDPVREEDEEPKGRQDCGTGQCVEGRGTAQCALVPLRKCLVNRDGGEYCDGNLAVQCGGAGYDRDAHDCSVNGQTCVMYDPGLGNYLRNACVLADTSCRQRYDMSVCADDHTIFSDCIGDHWVSRKTCGEGFLGLANLSWRCQVFGKVAGTDYTRDECVTDVPCTTPAADLCSPDGALVLRCGYNGLATTAMWACGADQHCLDCNKPGQTAECWALNVSCGP